MALRLENTNDCDAKLRSTCLFGLLVLFVLFVGRRFQDLLHSYASDRVAENYLNVQDDRNCESPESLHIHWVGLLSRPGLQGDTSSNLVCISIVRFPLLYITKDQSLPHCL